MATKKKKKTDNCEWESDKPCFNRGTIEIPWSGVLSNRTEAPKLCTRHATEYAHNLLERRLDEHGKWALDLVIREVAAEVFWEQRREEDYSG